MSSWTSNVKCACTDEKFMCNEILFNNRVFRCGTCRNYYAIDENEEIAKVSSIGIMLEHEPQNETKCDDTEKLYAFFENTQVALTKKELKEIGDSQPYMLPPRTYEPWGNLKIIDSKEPLTDKELGNMIYAGAGAGAGAAGAAVCSDELAYKLVKKARDYYNRFSKKNSLFSRHMVDFIFRERLEKTTKNVYEDLMTALERLLSQKLNRKFKNGAARDKYKRKLDWVYKDGENCTVNWVIELKDTAVDFTGVERRLKSSKYFCSKKLPEICEHKYYQTRNIKFLKKSEIKKQLESFKKCFKNCKLSKTINEYDKFSILN